MNQENQQLETQDSVDNLNKVKKTEPNSFSEILHFALIALLIVLPVRWFIAQPFIVSGSSMEETFHNNDYLIVDQLSYRLDDPKRGDVVIFRYPIDTSKFFIKRIIGLPGETVSVDGQTVTIINNEHPEGFVLSEDYANIGTKDNDTKITLKENEYFVLGDNRDHSSDSRVWGILPSEDIIGRALLRLYPPTQASLMPGDTDFNQ